MQMPVVIGVVLAIILSIIFSDWFFQIVQGWREYVIDDAVFYYRIAAATLFSLTVATLVFLGMAFAYECPGEKIESEKTIISGLQCKEYMKIKTGAEEMFRKEANSTEKTVPVTGMESFIAD